MQTSTLKPSAALANIRQLCCLGLGGEAIMPTLLEMLPDLLPCEKISFMWADEHGELSNLSIADDVPLDIKKLYLAEFYNARETEARPGFTQAMQMERGVAAWEQYYFQSSFIKSDFYNDIFRPMGVRHAAHVFITERGHNIGMLNLRRASPNYPFTAAEKELLGQIIPYVAHGLHKRPDLETNYMARQDFGLIVLNGQGGIEAVSDTGRLLLFLAGHPKISQATIQAETFDIGSILAQLRHCLQLALTGRGATAPVYQHQNNWGIFTFRAQLLGKEDCLTNNLIGVTIHFHEPRPIRLMRVLRAAPLSSRQKAICLLLADGLQHADIATRLNVSLSTVNSYVHEIYVRMQVHNHHELLAVLMGEAGLPLPVG